MPDFEVPVCTTCDGTGEIECDADDAAIGEMEECPDCDGSGYLDREDP